MVILAVTLGVFLVGALGEYLHARRARRLALLSFGPTRRPLAWVPIARALQPLALGAVAWGAATLMDLPPQVHDRGAVKDEDYKHLMLVLDVSPSMRLRDAGPTAKQSRRERARDVLDSLFQRVSIAKYKTSIVAVYNGAKPVVVDTKDPEVIRNILTDLPMEWAFRSGQTKLFEGLAEAARIAKPWPAKSTLMVLVSDGDTVPATGMPPMPPSISGVLVIGVGDPHAGRFIDGRQSRQDANTLRQIATRLGGAFHNGNALQVPSDTIRELTEGARQAVVERFTLREYALLAVSVGAAWLALLPVLLRLLGTRWQGGVPAPSAGQKPSPAPAKLAPAAAAAR